MEQTIYIARQPIVDHNQQSFGYELLFRSVQEDGSILSIFDDNLLATSRVLVNTLNHIGIKNLVGDQKAFINIDVKMLMDSMITTVPKERFVLELLETIIVDDKVIERIKELKKMGYTLALDDAHCAKEFLENFQPIFPYIDILKLDVSLIDTNILKKRISEFEKYNFKLLAEKVETQDEFETYKELGCVLFQGYFFAKPKIITQKAMDPHYKNIFNLIKQLDRDIEMDELSQEFERQLDITWQLLRFMNSGQMHLKTEVRSIKHAITLLGKAPLKQWLLLIIYSKSDHANTDMLNSPIMELASSRSKLMYELMNTLHQDRKRNHEAAFVGLLSLMNSIVHLPIEVILDELHIAQETRVAIVEHKGEMGSLLALALAVEEFHLEDANDIVHTLKISEESFKNALFTSMRSQEA